MKIGLIDIDGHHFPNLALMKLSAWHKGQGDIVEWYTPWTSRYDRVYASKVFSFSEDYTQAINADEEGIELEKITINLDRGTITTDKL